MIIVRRAQINDIPKIMKFLDEHWLNGYALANNRTFFDWQFVRDEKVNIWIGVDDDIGNLYAMQGAIVYNATENPDISGILWISTKCEEPTLSFGVCDCMLEELHPRYVVSPGITSRVAKFNRSIGNDVVDLDHFYRLSNLNEYKVAKVERKIIPPIVDCNYSFEQIYTIQSFKDIISLDMLKAVVPSKDYRYIEWRYFEHPIFKYDIWGIYDEEKNSQGVIITREETANGSKSCKIVDFYGENKVFEKIASPIDRLMERKGYEYIDVFSFGVDSDTYTNGGFVRCDENSNNIITNLFQPYTCVNSNISMVNPHVKGLRVMRGDSDQDKPRFI